MYNTHKNNAVINLTSSRSCGRQSMRDIKTLLTAPISRISSRLQGRDDEGRKDKENVGQVVPDNKIKRHSRMSLSGIPTAFNNAQGRDPRLKPLGMTTNLNLSPLILPYSSWRGNTNNPLPPGGGRCPVGADEGAKEFPSPLAGEGARRAGEGLLFSSPHVEEVAHSADGGAFVTNTPLPRCAVLSPQGGQKTARGFTTRSVIPQACNAGYSGRSGFTLIELLVVVLIIGILAAIAVPQYQKAMQKTKYTRLMAMLVPIARELERYYIEHGTYATSFDQLDIVLPSSTAKTCNTDFAYATKYVNGVCVQLLKEPVYGVRIAFYPGGRYSNGYVYALKKTYYFANLQKGFYCFQNVNSKGRDGFCKGAVKNSDAYGVYHSLE